MSSVDEAPAGPSVVRDKPPQKRSSKACETCRVRRIRCVGPPPCEPCRTAGLGSSCTVRLKARPKRAPSAKLFSRAHNPDAGPPPPPLPRDVAGGMSASPSDIYLERRNPLDELEAALAGWCADRGVPFSKLVFKVDAKLAAIPATPLPPEPLLAEYEDRLMDQLYQPVHNDSFEDGDHTLLRSLYGRYRAVPNSLTEDQKALVYSALCIARYSQVRGSINAGQSIVGSDMPREDVTYYHMAYNCLARWNRPSLVALWALFYMVPFAMGMGGPGESKDLLEQMAWQVRELGLHRSATASLYPPHDQAGALFSAFFYTEVSSLVDLRPALPFAEIDVDPTPPATMFPECLSRSSYFTTKLLADYGDPQIDTHSLGYITSTEASWMPFLRELRHAKNEAPLPKIAWAQFRYNWLRILLYLPHIGNPQLAPQAFAIISRAVQQIMYSYLDLIGYNQLNPSWPQVQRLVICGQLLILCHESGELHLREAQTLFQLLLDLLAKHQDTWPVCAELILGFNAAAQAFDLAVGPELSLPLLGAGSVANSLPGDNWAYNLALDFDLYAFPFTNNL